MSRGSYECGFLNRYDCEFDFLPNVLPSLYQKDEIDDYVMTHPVEWKKILIKKGIKSDFGINKISVEKEESSDGTIKFIFTFPKPQVTPECFYTVLIFDKNNNWRYYTLELDFGSSTFFKDGGGIVCGQKGPNHLNYGKRCKDNLDEFLKSVQDIMDGKVPNLSDLFKNVDYEAGGKMLGISAKEMEENCIIW